MEGREGEEIEENYILLTRCGMKRYWVSRKREIASFFTGKGRKQNKILRDEDK